MREKKNDPQGKTSQQEDFSNWLRRIPRDVLEELYQLYLFQKENILSRRRDQENSIPVFPRVNSNKSPPKGEVIVLRRSIFFLLATILGIEVFFDLFYFGLRFF